MKITDLGDISGVPSIEQKPGDDPLLSFRLEGLGYGGSDEILPSEKERREVEVCRLAVGRDENEGGEGRCLVMVVKNVGVPIMMDDAVKALGLWNTEHEGVAVVVMADVFLIEPREGTRLVGSAQVFGVPFGDNVHPIRVGKNEERKHIFEDFLGLGRRIAEKVIS